MGCKSLGAGSGGCRGSLSEAPTAPLQGTAEPPSQDSDASGKVCVRKGEMLPSSEAKSVRNSPVSPKGRGGYAPLWPLERLH